MVIVRLMGGIGNQMFQYAAARRLAESHRTVLKIDRMFLEGEQPGFTRRGYSLDKLQIPALFATPLEVERLAGEMRHPDVSLLGRMLAKAGFQGTKPEILRQQDGFDILSAPDNVYIEGYWQSERYFGDIEDLVRSEFSFRFAPYGKNACIAEDITSVNSVSVHIRRSDYLTDPVVRERHPVCELEYYLTCIEKLEERDYNLHYFVFSDDHEWARRNLGHISNITFVEQNLAKDPHEDLRLMSLCRHNIIANSSFSWWGAWLNRNPGKIVFAPKRWFNRRDHSTQEMIPSAWQRI